MAGWSETWTFVDGQWLEGNPPLTGPRSHAFWLASSVFDGGRVFDGVGPDLDLHFARINRSAPAIGLAATQSIEAMQALTWEGVKKFAPGTAIYVKPMYWAEGEDVSAILPDAASTRFCLCLFAAPMGTAYGGASITLSPYRRPTPESAPTDAKAGCLYPQNGRALREARSRGFSNALVRDALGNIAETCTANVFMVKDGTVFTPIPNGSFLNGITRQRTIALMRADGVEVVEKALGYADFETADEIFTSGNYSKIVAVTRIDARDLQPGPLTRRARDLYMDYAHTG
jgi:branched-chain amino acid aminotransferase